MRTDLTVDQIHFGRFGLYPRERTLLKDGEPIDVAARAFDLIDDKLMRDTLRLTGLKTKREAVELGLRTLVRLRQQEQVKRFRGKLKWTGDLDAMRSDG
jgi:Arc/MetJ family transcription regulator